ncbi:SulP family inorganic anion transporter, partial [Actinomadura bangladeshensis]
MRRDLLASFVVFLVAVPLSLGIAVASGAPVAAGLVAAVAGGIVAGLLGGSPLQVSGPAAGLTVLVAELVQTYGWRATCTITMLGGLLQLALGAGRIARAALAVSPAVVHGMLAGVGAVIVLAEVHVVLGGSPQQSAVANLRELPGQLAHPDLPTALLGGLTVLVLLGWSRLPRGGRLRLVPGPLPAV